MKRSRIAPSGVLGSKVPPEVDLVDFAPRVRAPTMMLNGRYDFVHPPATLQPLFQLLDTPTRDKRYVLINSGHIPPLQDIMREVLDWLDRYLGPVQTIH